MCDVISLHLLYTTVKHNWTNRNVSQSVYRCVSICKANWFLRILEIYRSLQLVVHALSVWFPRTYMLMMQKKHMHQNTTVVFFTNLGLTFGTVFVWLWTWKKNQFQFLQRVGLRCIFNFRQQRNIQYQY